ncbi:bestrophin family protein [Edaphobacter bradus]|uniref:bestrophin family protein n=1 Tax=Edaphobacter bradus TaxID=2259016 RepID=UPI0021E0237F|nr:bestrophin family ion channel [Edaphobacter bradus]
MIVPRSRQLLLHTVQYVGRPLLVLLAYDIFVVVAYKMGLLRWKALDEIPVSLFGSAIGVVLAFRNATSYARWWEARTLWGAIVNNARSFGRQVTTVMRPRSESDEADLRMTQRRMVYHQIAYAHSLRQYLRRLEPWAELAPLLNETEIEELRTKQNVPLAILQEMGVMLREAIDNGWINDIQSQQIERSLDDLADAQGGAERLQNTPMPRQYDYFPQLFVQIYCVLLPLAMVSSLGWLTPLGSTLVGFIFLALDKIGRDLEDPFDNTEHDIPLTSITRTIEINLRQQLGETEVPKPLAPVDGVLW